MSSLAHRMSRVPSRHVTRMALLSPADIPMAIGLGAGMHIRLLIDIARFRHRAAADTWSSLSEVYPRRYVLTYYLMTFAWARFCGVHQELLERPQLALPAEIFVRYVCELDARIDRPGGSKDERLHPRTAQSTPRARAIAGELLHRLRDVTPDRKPLRRVVRLSCEYRDAALSALLAAPTQGSSRAFTNALAVKERSSGGLFGSWAAIMGVLYDVPLETTARAQEVSFCFGMLLQIFDDFVDVAEDARNGQANMLLAATADTGEDVAELLRVAQRRWAHVTYDGSVLAMITPRARERVLAEAERYISRLILADPEARVAPTAVRVWNGIMLPWR
jgi:hypothetical protein